MARILVTGASGFIGSHVVERLAELGHQIIATGRCKKQLGRFAQNVQIIAADLCHDKLEPIVDACDFVVHCAALSSPWDTAENFWQANVVATERLLAASQQVGVRRFVQLGSPSIYFRFADQYSISESFEAPRKWVTEYARSKWESELRVRAASANSEMETLILRPRAVFGERDRAILPRLLAIAEKGWFPLMHRGKAVIDVTYVANVADIVDDCLEANVVCDGRAYNLTNGDPITVHELVTRLFTALDRDVRLIPVPRRLALSMATVAEQIARMRSGAPEPRLTRYGVGVIGYSQTLDISRARSELNYSPRVSINEGITRFAKWWKLNAKT